MLQRLFHRILFFFTLCSAIVVTSIFMNKDDFRDTSANLNIAYLPEKYWLIDFVFGWPIIVGIIIVMMWITLQQFRIDSVVKKMKINALFLLSIFIIAMTWMSIIYIPFYSSVS